MNKNIIALGDSKGNVTADEIIERLIKVPANWEVSFAGESNPGIYYDEDKKLVLFDNMNFLTEEFDK